MASIHSFLKSSKDALRPVYIRINDAGKNIYQNTGFLALAEDFDAKAGRYKEGVGIRKFFVNRKESGVMKEYSNHDANAILAALEAEFLDQMKRLAQANPSFRLEDVKSAYKRASASSRFSSFAEEIVDNLKKEGRTGSALILHDCLKSFRRFDSKFDGRLFKEIDVAYLNSYKAWNTACGNKVNTIAMYLREIRSVFNTAIKKSLIAIEQYPFGSYGVKIPKNEPANKRFVPLAGLRKMNETQFADHDLEVAKHLFIFMMHCRGINWKDAARLTVNNIERGTTEEGREVEVLKYVRSKTKGKFEIQVTEQIRKELDWFKDNTLLFGDHLLPIIKTESKSENDYIKSQRTKFNRRLKLIAKEIGLPESQSGISAYWARHSFAMALFSNGTNKAVIQQALGHSDISVTENYLAGFSTEEMAKLTTIEL